MVPRWAARHEAGHAVLGAVFGFGTPRTIQVGRNGTGHLLIAPNLVENARSQRRRVPAAITLLAGYAAQWRHRWDRLTLEYEVLRLSRWLLVSEKNSVVPDWWRVNDFDQVAGLFSATLEKVRPCSPETLHALWRLTCAVLRELDIWEAVERLTTTILNGGGQPTRDAISCAIGDLASVSPDYLRSRGFPCTDSDPLPPDLVLPPLPPPLSPVQERQAILRRRLREMAKKAGS